MTNDPRRGKVSASKFEMVACCNGQPQLEEVLRLSGELPEIAPDPMALRGSKIHLALETGDESQLSTDELEDCKKAKELDELAVKSWIEEKQTEGIQLQSTEQRVWLYNGNNEPLCSGQFDRLTISGNHAFVRDFKSGFCRRLSPSQQNWQLRLLAVLVWLEYGTKYRLETVRASFLKPKLKRSIDTVEYTVDDLMRANTQIRQILWQSRQPGAQRTPGDHCFYCPCASRCPEAGAYTMFPAALIGGQQFMSSDYKVTKKDVEQAVIKLSQSDWKVIWERSNVIRNILDAVNTNLKALPPIELDSLGLYVTEGRRKDEITNIEGAFKYLEHQLKAGRLWSCLKFNKSALVSSIMAEKRMTKKDAEAWVSENLDVFIEHGRTEGWIEEKD